MIDSICESWRRRRHGQRTYAWLEGRHLTYVALRSRGTVDELLFHPFTDMSELSFDLQCFIRGNRHHRRECLSGLPGAVSITGGKWAEEAFALLSERGLSNVVLQLDAARPTEIFINDRKLKDGLHELKRMKEEGRLDAFLVQLLSNSQT